MKVRVGGDSITARSLRTKLRMAGVAVVEEEGKEDYLVEVEEEMELREVREHIWVDGVDSELERRVVTHISNLATVPIVLRRGGESDRKIRIGVREGRVEEGEAVAIGAMRGIMIELGMDGRKEESNGSSGKEDVIREHTWSQQFPPSPSPSPSPAPETTLPAPEPDIRSQLSSISASHSLSRDVGRLSTILSIYTIIQAAILLFILLTFVTKARGQQQGPVDVMRVGGTVQSAANVIDAANTAVRVNVVAGGAGGGVAQTQVRNAGDTTWENVGPANAKMPMNLQQYLSATVGVANPVHITCVSGCGGAAAFDDNAPFTAGSTDIANVGGVFNDGLAAVTSGNAAAPRITSFRGLHVNMRDNNGNEIATANPTLNSTGTGIRASQLVGQFDDTTPTTITENQFGNFRMSANRNLYGTLRDAAGNERGVNVTVGNALVVDGSASTQPVSGTVTVGTFPDNEPFNVAQFGGSVVVTGTGTGGVGIPRVTVSNDSSVIVGTFPDNEPFNVAQFGGSAVVTGTGASGVGIPRVTISNDSSLAANQSVNVSQIGASVVSTVAAGVQKNGIADSAGTAFLSAVDALNSTGGGVQASQVVGQFDDTTPVAITEGQFGNLRMSANRNAYTSLRDAAGNERGVNVTAGNALVVDGSASTQPVSGTVTVGTFPDNEPINVAQFGGSVVVTGTGASGVGIPRVTVANDSSVIIGTFPDNEPFNVAQFGGSAVATGTGAGGVGIPRVTISNDSSLAANQSVNVAQFGASAVVTGTGTGGAGIPRVTVSNDSSVIIGTFPDNEPFNLAQIVGTAPTVNNGTAGAGSQRSVLASDNSAIANWGHAAIAAAPPTGSTQISGTTSGATGGLLKGFTVCDLFANIVQTGNAQVITGVASRRIYICALNVVSATAQNVAVVAGTGTVCDTTTVAVPGTSGGATAATGWNFAANGGISIGGGIGAVAKTTVDANNLCVFQSGSGQLSGAISYAIY